MLDAVECLSGVKTVENRAHVRSEEEVAIAEHDPTRLGREIGRKKARQGEFGGRAGIVSPGVKSKLTEDRLPHWNDGQVLVSVPEERMATNLPRNILTGVIAYEDLVTHTDYHSRPIHGCLLLWGMPATYPQGKSIVQKLLVFRSLRQL